MFFSRSDYFKQSSDILNKERIKLVEYLFIKGYNREQIRIYLRAFNFFTKNPSEYDGATLVKDLTDFPGLDLDAMLHDYQYVVFNVCSNFMIKLKCDWLYAKMQEKKGKSVFAAYSRFLGLFIASIFLVPIRYFTRGKITDVKKYLFLEDYKKFIN